MSAIIFGSPIKLRAEISEKNTRRFSGILRRLSKLDNSIKNMKVTVSEGEISEKNIHDFIAPSKFKNCFELLENPNLPEKLNKNLIENFNVEKINYSPHDIEVVDYPDSSDFSDDE